jgi:alpha-tubulin suppressor-like RCC1 family protein
MNARSIAMLAFAAGSAALSSCSSGPSSPPSPNSSSGHGAGTEPTGAVTLAITIVPPGVQCIQVTAAGSFTVTQSFAATPDAGAAGSLALGALPLGSVTITGQAFNTPCSMIASQTPSWVAVPQTVVLAEGVVTSLTLTFRPDNQVTGTPTFVGNVAQIAPGNNTIALVMSDGTVEAAGNLAGNAVGPAFGTAFNFTNIAQLAPSISDFWACATLKNGTAACTGAVASFGQLGNGTTTPTASLVTVSGLSNVVQVAAGDEHACAELSSNQVWCWGNNGNGELGNNTITNATTPVQVTGIGMGTGTVPSSVSCGAFHTCAIAAGVVWCWGFNGFGQLGNNTTTDSHVPVQLSNLGAGITQLALGDDHTCALRADGSVFCWGDNGSGQLGQGNQTNLLAPTKVPITNVVQIGAGNSFTCARRGDGTVWCWGFDFSGEVGDGTAQFTVLSPVQVVGLPPSASLSVGAFDSCSVGTDLSIECWGYNSFGQLGNGTNGTPAFVPTPIRL